MIVRLVTLLGVAAACSACANDPIGKPMRLHSGSLSSGAIVRPADDPALHTKTMSDKVLTAIALEKVTGRKPDPARLSVPSH